MIVGSWSLEPLMCKGFFVFVFVSTLRVEGWVAESLSGELEVGLLLELRAWSHLHLASEA